ncbi:hypothetical protein [Fluviicola sp.]|uniref:hypothetical protein n=1 Tax=Fluviicola sp. TaxID=1917219 RepID=UPI002824982D|nr:hypothetical protein [Fluviicola sp.]MDR0802705.1 hypothetical protein [Fluviicola sp.]
MKYLPILLFSALMAGIASSCGEEKAEPKVEAGQNTPEYKAYDLVQNLEIVKKLQTAAERRNQKISLQLSKDLLNGKNGYYWFQVIQQIGSTKIVKMNVKVRENNFKVTILDDDNGSDLTPEEYEHKYPVKE